MPARATVGAPPSGLNGEIVSIESSLCPGPLAGWYFKGKPGRGVVLLLHGYRASRKSQVNRIKLLLAADFSVLAIDFHAHGESPGKSITLGDTERYDVVAAVQWLRERNRNERIGIIGTSMGGAAAILAAPEIRADAFVIEQVFSNIVTAMSNRLAMRLGEGSRIFAEPSLQLASLFTQVDPKRLDLVTAIREVRTPILIIAGLQDKHATPAESDRLFLEAAEPKEIWKVEGVAHIDLATAVPEQYTAHVVPFLSKSLAPGH